MLTKDNMVYLTKYGNQIARIVEAPVGGIDCRVVYYLRDSNTPRHRWVNYTDLTEPGSA